MINSQIPEVVFTVCRFIQSTDNVLKIYKRLKLPIIFSADIELCLMISDFEIRAHVEATPVYRTLQ